VGFNEKLREKTQRLLPPPGDKGGDLLRSIHERLRLIETDHIDAHDAPQVIDKHRETDGVEEAVDFHDFTDPAPTPGLIKAVEYLLKSNWWYIATHVCGPEGDKDCAIWDALRAALASAKADDAKRRNELDALRKFHDTVVNIANTTTQDEDRMNDIRNAATGFDLAEIDK